MAKIGFTKLSLKRKNEVKTITINNNQIEIKQYLPVNEKLDLIARVINGAHDQNNFPNPIKIEVIGTLEMIMAYTNISFTEKQKEDIQQVKPKSVKRSKPKTGSATKNNTGMDELKEFLQANATADFNPASLTMGIYEAISQTVLEGTPIKEALKNIIIIDAKIDSLNHALQGKWNKIQDIVEKILKEKGKI